MNGELKFGIGLDNSQLQKDAARASKLISGVGDTAKAESARIDSSFSGIGSSLAAIGGTAAITMLGKSILDTTAKFEKFGIVLRNTLGDKEGNDSLDMIAQFAATTPFQLDEVTAAFIKMANQGFVPTRDEMVKLGDVASSTGKSFDQLTEALLDAQTGQFERLKEFGIKASSQGDKVTFSFKEQQTTVDNTNSAIQRYILSLGELKGVQGANALISQSLTGQISNLEDKLAAMYNNIGKSNSGVLYAAVGGVTSLIDNYETVGEVLFGLVATYGTYKAAVFAVNAVSAIQTQIAYQQMLANIGNTGATVNLTTAQGLQAIIASRLTQIQLALNKSMLANPYVLATMAILGLAAAMASYAASAKDAKTEKEMINDLESEGQKNTKQEVATIETLKKILNSTNRSYDERKVALDKLKEIVPAYHADLTAEGNLINNNAAALDTYVKKLVISEKLKVAASKQSNADEAFNNFKTENSDVLKTALKKQLNGESLFAGEAGALETYSKLAVEATNYGKVIEQLQSDLVSIDAVKAVKKPSKTPAQIKAELAAEKKAREAEQQMDNSGLKLTNNLIKEGFEQRQAKLNNDKELINLEVDGYQKQKNLLDNEHEQNLLDIEKRQQELVERQQEAEKLAWEKNGKKGLFSPATTDASKLSTDNKASVSDLQETVEIVYVEKNQTLLDEVRRKYQGYINDRLDIDKKYADDKKAIDPNDSVRLNVLDQQHEDALSALDRSIAEKEITFKGFLDNIVSMGLKELTTALETAKSTLDNSSSTLSGDDKAILRAKIKALQDEIKAVKTNNGKDTEANVKTNSNLKTWGDTATVIGKANAEIGSMVDSIDGLDDATKSALKAVSNISSAVVSSIIGIIALSKTGSEAIKGVERASVILAIISAAITVITTIANLINAQNEEYAKNKQHLIDLQTQEYLGAISYNEELRKRYNWVKKIGEEEAAYQSRKAAELTRQQADNQKEQDSLLAKLQGEEFSDGTKKINKRGLTLYRLTGLGKDISGYEEVEKFSKLTGKNWEEISKLAAEGKLSAEAMKYYEALKKAKEEGVDIERMQLEQLEELKKRATGTTADSIANSIVEGFKAGKRSAADFADSFGEMMQASMQSALKTQIIDSTQQFYDHFAELSKDGLNETEKATLKAEWDALVTKAQEDAKGIETLTGGSITSANATRQASSKGIESMTQESATELNGRFTAMQGSMFSIAENMKILQSNSAEALLHLSGIKTNTDRLEAIENSITAVKNGIETINLKGLILRQ